MSKAETKIVPGEYVRAPAGKIERLPVINDSGMTPVEYRCVVRLDPVEKQSAGGVWMPDSRVDMDQMAGTEGVLLAVGGNAFEDWEGTIPQPGDRVMINKYSGQFREANPDDLHRVVNDKDILAILS